MCVICSHLHYAQGATATVEPHPRSHRQGRRESPRIAARLKNHLAIARACNEANTVGIDESGTYKKRAVIKNCALRRTAAIRGQSGDNIKNIILK